MTMKTLIKKVKSLKESKVRVLVDKRIKEFKEMGKRSSREIFKELCFCILTANFNAERSIKIQKEIGEGFLTLSESRLSKKLRKLGHRFPDMRARYIVNARNHASLLRNIIDFFDDEKKLREWLVKNIKGIGYKEASHFLRNIGYTDFAIIDFHILDILTEHGIIKKPKTLSKKRYLEIENLLRRIAKKLNLSLAELDLYLWYMKTGKVLK
jgi:N-glycosylase/DNA lyase